MFEETLLQQVQELQRQVAALQNHIRNNPPVDRGNSPSKEATNSGTSQGTSEGEPVVAADCTSCKLSGSDNNVVQKQSNPVLVTATRLKMLPSSLSSYHHFQSLMGAVMMRCFRSG